jgi:uncharacterized protein YggU (UPF0235/DUF167 family)
LSVWQHVGDDLRVAIRLTPGAADEAIGGLWTDAKGTTWLAARVRAVPEKGRANDALLALLGKRVDWPKGAILLESGDTNRLKRVRIIGGGRDERRLAALLQTWVEQT